MIMSSRLLVSWGADTFITVSLILDLRMCHQIPRFMIMKLFCLTCHLTLSWHIFPWTICGFLHIYFWQKLYINIYHISVFKSISYDYVWTIIFIPSTTKLLYPRNEVRGGILDSPCLSVRLSVCLLTFRVRSVASTVPDGFFPYLVQKNNSMRGCVACDDLWPWPIYSRT